MRKAMTCKLRCGRWLVLVSCLLPLLVTGICSGQNLTGTINGSVSDSSGAMVPGATVTIANAETGVVERSIKTDSGGRYQAPALLAGTYRITIQANGFAPVVVASVPLNVDQSIPVNITLKLGTVTSQVSVAETISGPDVEDSAQGTLIEQKEVTELPLNQRNFRAIYFSSAGREWRFGNHHSRTVGCGGRKQPHEHFGKRAGNYFERLLS